MKVVSKSQDLQKVLDPLQKQGLSNGFVPTMGALHEGHLSLIRRAKKENAFSVLSIFVNPTQFGPNEDFDRYPRQLEKDIELANKEKVDIVFTPERGEIYRPGYSTFIEETTLSKGLCGAHRPGHFRGVSTVVFRLFQLVHPDRAYFGTKDGQQLRVVEKMVEDLALPVKIIPCPTIREADGLAMSSRNAYLTAEERKIAVEIYQALLKATTSSTPVESAAKHLAQFPQIAVQYIELRRWSDFAEITKVEEKSILAIAAQLGPTRLIDNVIL